MLSILWARLDSSHVSDANAKCLMKYCTHQQRMLSIAHIKQRMLSYPSIYENLNLSKVAYSWPTPMMPVICAVQATMLLIVQ